MALEQLFRRDLGPVVPSGLQRASGRLIQMSVVRVRWRSGDSLFQWQRKRLCSTREKPMVRGRRFSAVVLNPGADFTLLCAGLFRRPV